MYPMITDPPVSMNAVGLGVCCIFQSSNELLSYIARFLLNKDCK